MHDIQEDLQLLNLLEDDEHWQKTIEEAAISKSPNKIRTLFAMMICHCEISDIPALWMVNRECMSEDILHRYRRDNEEQNYTEEIFTTALQLLQEKVQKIGGERMENYGFEEVEIISTVSDEHNYEVIIQENEMKLNDEQRIVYNTILESINNEDGTLFFLDAPAGTGKTFLINLLLAKMKMANKEHIAVASSGIAATLLLNGRIAHSIFKIPIQLNEDYICSINKNSKSGKLFKSCTFIVWDECTMTHKHALEAVDRMLRYIVNKDKPM